MDQVVCFPFDVVEGGCVVVRDSERCAREGATKSAEGKTRD
jgi:hypothetical protein